MTQIEVSWLGSDGSKVTASVPVGSNLMEAAVANGVAGIFGDCGGALACATCHVFLTHPVPSGDPSDMEDAMLEMTEVPRSDTSRLSCQLIASPEIDGIVLRIP